MGMGFVAARVLSVPGEPVSKLIFYLIVPIVFFNGALHAPLSLSVLSLPLVPFAISSLLCLLFYYFGQHMFRDATRNLLALSAGNANVGYFGLPVAYMLFDTKDVSLYMVLMLGTTLYESTLGYYIAARGQFTAEEALRKVLRLPVIYGFSAGLLLNALNVHVPVFLDDFFFNVRGCYTVLGMMIIGIGLAQVKEFSLDLKFTACAFFGKFICYPLLALAFIALDNSLLHWYSAQAHAALMLLSIVPMAANAVVIATLLNVQPAKAAVAVFLSTLFALFYVPLMVMWMIRQ